MSVESPNTERPRRHRISHEERLAIAKARMERANAVKEELKVKLSSLDVPIKNAGAAMLDRGQDMAEAAKSKAQELADKAVVFLEPVVKDIEEVKVAGVQVVGETVQITGSRVKDVLNGLKQTSKKVEGAGAVMQDTVLNTGGNMLRGIGSTVEAILDPTLAFVDEIKTARADKKGFNRERFAEFFKTRVDDPNTAYELSDAMREKAKGVKGVVESIKALRAQRKASQSERQALEVQRAEHVDKAKGALQSLRERFAFGKKQANPITPENFTPDPVVVPNVLKAEGLSEEEVESIKVEAEAVSKTDSMPVVSKEPNSGSSEVAGVQLTPEENKILAELATVYLERIKTDPKFSLVDLIVAERGQDFANKVIAVGKKTRIN